jgi:hypothetical protein
MTELKENATAKAARLRAEATARRADTTTPIDTLGKAPLASVPEPPAAEDAPEMPRIEIRTTVEHRGRSFVIVANGYTLDQFCDILDKRAYTPAQQTQEWQRLPDGTPICPKHHAPMRQREKQGDLWWSHNVGTKEQPVYCKGYHGKDSPGYER